MRRSDREVPGRARRETRHEGYAEPKTGGYGRATYPRSGQHCQARTPRNRGADPSLYGGQMRAPLFLVGTTLLAQTKLRDTMPATYPETVADDVKLDILTHLLH